MEILNDHRVSLPEHILKALEQYWGFTLPKQYRNFLLKHNGGTPVNDYFTFKGKEKGSDLRYFLGIIPVEHKNLLVYMGIYRERIPLDTFPIGCDSLGNLILLSIKGPDRGKIYFWDHEMESYEDEDPNYSNLTLISDDFDEFINSLRSADEIAPSK